MMRGEQEGGAGRGVDEPTIGYLVSCYPAPSHTFISREVDALAELGVPVRTYSVRRAAAGNVQPDTCAGAKETFVILGRGVAGMAIDHIATFLRHPLRYLTVLMLALRHRTQGLRPVVWALFHFVEAVILAAQLRRDGIGHLHNHFANSGATVGMLASRLNGIGWSLTLHGISEFDHPAGYLLPDKIARAEFVVCASYFVRAQAMRTIEPAHWSKMHIVRCAISPLALPTGAPQRGTGDFQIVCVARLSAEKAHSGLLAAVEQLVAEGLALHVQLIGDGPDRGRLETEVRSRGLQENCTFSGYLDEAATLRAISAADLLVLPSFMEGLPTVLVEALALGVPVVATGVAGIPELVIDEETGLLFRPSDWHDLATQIGRYASDPELRERHAMAGRKIVRDEFMHPQAAQPLKHLFLHEG